MCQLHTIHNLFDFNFNTIAVQDRWQWSQATCRRATSSARQRASNTNSAETLWRRLCALECLLVAALGTSYPACCSMLHARDLVASAFVVTSASRTRAVALIHERLSFLASVLRQFEAPRRSVLSVQHAASERRALSAPHSRASARVFCSVNTDVCKRGLVPPRAHTASRDVLHRQLGAATPSNAPGTRAYRSTPACEGDSRVDEKSKARLQAAPDLVRSLISNSAFAHRGSGFVWDARHPALARGDWRMLQVNVHACCRLCMQRNKL